MALEGSDLLYLRRACDPVRVVARREHARRPGRLEKHPQVPMSLLKTKRARQQIDETRSILWVLLPPLPPPWSAGPRAILRAR